MPRQKTIRILLTALLLSGMSAGAAVVPMKEASAFGAINGAGQHAEHERITRAALGCLPGVTSDGFCFEPISLNQLAGHVGTFGAVGSPDSDESFDTDAHCDDADFIAVPGYGQTRARASAYLISCIVHLQGRFATGITEADDVLSDGSGAAAVLPHEVDLSSDCTFVGGVNGRAKCDAMEGFGRALHGVQDFYSHSNWSDVSDTSKPIGLTNPPGLNMTTISPLMRLESGSVPSAASIPVNLSTGCFTLLFGCSKRTEHDDLNKDTGLINPWTGTASSPTTPRGKVGKNFEQAVHNAIADTRRQWADFRARLRTVYGAERGRKIACVLTSDSPVQSCT
ncbi:CinY protein [Streptomyces rubiginosohelvolus]|uniref:CinY protein n=1 Tax=Streptomyces rubiginosohelvolus TaxID=67362 RepID=UPI0034247375